MSIDHGFVEIDSTILFTFTPIFKFSNKKKFKKCTDADSRCSLILFSPIDFSVNNTYLLRCLVIYQFVCPSSPQDLMPANLGDEAPFSFPPSGSGAQTVIFFLLCRHHPFPLLGFLLFKSATASFLFPLHVPLSGEGGMAKLKKIINLRGRSEFNFWLCRLLTL